MLVLVLIVSAMLGAASAYFLTAIGLFFTSLIFVAALALLPSATGTDALTLLAAFLTIQVTYVAAGWLRSDGHRVD